MAVKPLDIAWCKSDVCRKADPKSWTGTSDGHSLEYWKNSYIGTELTFLGQYYCTKAL